MERQYVICPVCEGCGEEPGAPVDLFGDYICNLCNGCGEVTTKIALEYIDNIS